MVLNNFGWALDLGPSHTNMQSIYPKYITHDYIDELAQFHAKIMNSPKDI